MRKLKLVSLLLLLLIGVGQMWATEAPTTFANKASSKTWAQVQSALPCTSGGLTWASSATVSGWDSNDRGFQFSAVSSNLTTTIANATISQIVVVASSNTANNSMSVSVGGINFKSSNQESVTITKTNNTTYTWTGSASGEITVSFIAGNNGKSMYVKSITVTYTSGGTPQPTI